MRLFDRHRRETGAVAVMMALVICFVLIPLAAFTVDLGMQRVARKDMQAVADTVALDMARELNGGTTPSNSDATASAALIKGVTGKTPTVTVRVGYLNLTDTSKYTSNQSLGCGVPSGTAINNGYFSTTIPSGQSANAVLVTASGSVNFSIHGGSGSVCRSAIGQAQQNACMTMDSYAAALHTGDSTVLGPLLKILGTNIDLGALNSSGILDTSLGVLSFLNVLQTNLGVGSFDQVLNTQVTAAQIVQAEIDALNKQGGAANAAAQFLQSAIGAHIPALGSIKVGDLLGLTQGGMAGLATNLNPLDLAAAAIQLANGTNPVAVTVTGQNLTGLSVSATIGSRPMSVCLGDGTKTMSQSSITATADINAPGTLTGALTSLVNALNGLLSGVLGLLGSLLGGDTYDLPQVTLGKISATVKLATASGKVTAVNCDGGQAKSLSVLEGASLAPITLTIPISVTETRHYGGVLGVGRKSESVTSTINIIATTDPTSDKSVADTLLVPDDVAKGKAGPAGDLSLGNLRVSVDMTSVNDTTPFSNGYFLFNKLLNGVTSVANSITTNLLAPLTSTVITPLLNTLTTTLKNLVGLTVAGSNYKPNDNVSCGTPNLKG